MQELVRAEAAAHWLHRASRELIYGMAQRFLPEGERFLDGGAGSGQVLAPRGERYDAWGVEPSAAARAAAGTRRPPPWLNAALE